MMLTETMTPEEIKKLTALADQNPDDIMQNSLKIVSSHPDLVTELKEAQRKLQLAKHRELMDDYQIKLAYRLTLRNLIKRITEN